jgi:purine/pyrimidine-nucleoside phosphorylase
LGLHSHPIPGDRQGADLPETRRSFNRLGMSIPSQFPNVTAVARANVYFDGRVVSHSLLFPDSTKKTLGLIYPGTYHFGTDLAEKMEITDGTCEVKLDGSSEIVSYPAGSTFFIPAKSGFDISVKSGICQYICSFIP